MAVSYLKKISPIESDDASLALKFLQTEYAHLHGYVSVAAIAPNGKMEISTTATDSIDELANFISQHNGISNLYFSVNLLKTCLQKKSSKSDVESLTFFHVDIDPREGYSFNEERDRILKLIKSFPIMPSVIVDSGGGYQCFWRISPNIAIENNVAEFEGYNKRLAHALGGDKCWSLEHLMRLPSTWNLPTDKKKEKGQVKALAKIIDQNNKTYTIKDFESLPKLEVPTVGEVIPISPCEIPLKFYELLKSDHKLKARWEGNTIGLVDKSRSGLDMSVAQLLYQHGLSKPEIAAILFEFPHGKGAQEGFKYISLTLSKLGGLNKAQGSESMTDLGNARQLITNHGEKIRYCHVIKKWLIWDGFYWHWDDDEQIMRYAKETASYMLMEAAYQDDDTRKSIQTKWALKSQDIKRLQAMIELAKSEPDIPISLDQLDSNKFHFGVSNGVLDLRSGHLIPYNPMDYITKSVKIEYDPDAQCPTWLAFLNQIFDNDQDLVGFVQRAVGYSLTGDASEECLFFLHGDGANGKTTFLNTILAITGKHGRQCASETMMTKRDRGIPNDIARLRGARFVATSETDAGQRFAESQIKQLTGRDKIVARHLYAEYFEFEPEFKIWLAANHKPTIQGNDYAIWRRIKLIPFKVTIPKEKQDKYLASKLHKELPGILNWALQGCLEWQKVGLEEPIQVLNATQGYKDEMDSIGNWMTDCCDIANAKQGKASTLYESYKSWCTEIGEKSLSNQQFSQAMQSRGFQRKPTNHGNYYLGISLHLQPDF